MEWIKIEKGTPDKPAIRHIARACGVSRGDAFLGWFRLWAWFDTSTADGIIPHMTADDCDDVSGVPGMGAALIEVGWCAFSDAGCQVAGWEKHNGRSAKQRSVNGRCMARLRAERGGHEKPGR